MTSSIASKDARALSLPRKDAQHPSTPKAAFYSYRAMLPLHRRRPRFVEAEKVVYRRGDGAQKTKKGTRAAYPRVSHVTSKYAVYSQQ